jgi:hypothetical protein
MARSNGFPALGRSPYNGLLRPLAVVLTMVSAVALIGASPARGSPSWQVGELPPVSPSPPIWLPTVTSVSCPSVGFCVAVGDYNADGVSLSPELTYADQNPTAEILSEGAWSVIVLPMPPGASQATLTAVSCTSTTSCIAVGSYGNLTGSPILYSEILAGTAWTPTPMAPAPVDAFVAGGPQINAVSCTTATSCVAVGTYGGGPMVETMTGTTWTLTNLATPSGSHSGLLTGVSCPSSTFCTAIGNYDGQGLMDATLSGAIWSSTAMPTLGEASLGIAGAVSCATPLSCVAVYGSLGETLTNGTWTATALPVPVGATSVGMTALSCGVPDSCVAVGYAGIPPSTDEPVAETLTDGSWTEAALPIPNASAVPSIFAVSCNSGTECVTVGDTPTSGSPGQLPFIEVLAGGGWSSAYLPVPNAVPAAILSSVSCASATSCTAVGTAVGPLYAAVPFAETLANGVWTQKVLMVPAAAGSTGGYLQGVSCAGVTSCVAVGFSITPAGERPMAEVLSGGTWRPRALPVPPEGLTSDVTLSAISCISSASCVAVGAVGGDHYGLIERLARGTWRATVVSRFTRLDGVTCQTTLSCMAVGSYANRSVFEGPLAVTVSGDTWKRENLRLPYGAANDWRFEEPMLASVSCPTPAGCLAVGLDAVPVDSTAAMAESLSGTNWSATNLPTLPLADQSAMSGVSCTSITSCVAVGTSDGTVLLESLSSTGWAASSLLSPVGDSAVTLESVSCWSATACVAVGGALGPSGVFPVVARYGS